VNEQTGFKRALSAAWDQLPHILVAAVVAIIVLIGGIWLGLRDVNHSVSAIQSEYSIDRFCERVGNCPCFERMRQTVINIVQADERLAEVQKSHEREAEQWKTRIERLESQVYDILTKSNARPDPFTGTMGRELEDRINRLELKKPNS